MLHRQLPNGELTKNARVYTKAWNKLGKKMASKLPGYIMVSYDPGFRFEKHEMLHDGTYRVLDAAELSLWTVKTLLNIKD